MDFTLSEGCAADSKPEMPSTPHAMEVRGELLDNPKQPPATRKAGRRHREVRMQQGTQQATAWSIAGGGHWPHRTLCSVWMFAMLMISMPGPGVAMPLPALQPYADFPLQLSNAGQHLSRAPL